ncbi:nucleoside permease [Rapidithrix thailandica]|uniref:Nucleoside permease n=1 Tax=Rapidithrix thailandica TaxID=413964 RepID=A0AAW9S6L1_9BACT
MKLKVRFQLSSMMFLQYFIWGAWSVTMSTYLGKTLGFSDVQIGMAYGAGAIAAMISPFFMGMIADRFFASERVLFVLHLVGAVFLYLAADATLFDDFYLLLLAYTICYMPTIALTNSISMNQMKDPGKEFPGVRVLGTIGWIAAGWTVGLLNIEHQATTFYIASGVSALMGFYCLLLPHTPPKDKGKKVGIKEVIGWDAISLFKSFSFSVFFIASMLICIPLSFYYNFTNAFLNELGMENAAGNMSWGQVSEILFMLVMPFFFIRLGVKKMLMVGMFAWVARYIMFSYGNIDEGIWMLFVGIVLHGVCYDFFFVTGQIYVDKKAGENVKNAAQGLIAFATYGVGMFIGAYISGQVVEYYKTEGTVPHDWSTIWMVPAMASGIILILFTMLFHEKKKQKEEEPAMAN